MIDAHAVLAAVLLAAAVGMLAAPAGADPPDFARPVCSQPAVTDLKIVNDRWPDASSPRQFALDAIRIEGAKTDQEKAIAVWLWVRRFTMYTNGNAPAERGPNGPRYVSDPVKILNVWGAHWCDGLARCMELCWRQLGYPAQKFYKSGHTLCDAGWVDDDGVMRYHLFDVSEGWFAFTRDGKRIAGAEDLCRDHSLAHRPAVGPALRTHSLSSLYGWVHATHLPLESTHKMELQMRPWEIMDRGWEGRETVASSPFFQDNVGKKADNVPEEHWPYLPFPGLGAWDFPAPMVEQCVRNQCCFPPVNCKFERPAGVEPSDENAYLTQADPARPAVLVYRILTPYIIAQMRVHAQGSQDRQLQVEVSDNDGKTWGEPEKLDSQDLFASPGHETKDPRQINAFGRYDVLVRVSLLKGSLRSLRFHTWVQQNIFSLPQLRPGDNRMTVTGNLAKGYALEVEHMWVNDTEGSPARGSTWVLSTTIPRLPYTYTIHAPGSNPSDVRSFSVTVQVVPDDGKGPRSELRGPPASQPDRIERMAGYMVSLGKFAVPPLKTLDEYLAALKWASNKNELSDALAGIRVIAFNDPKVAADGAVYDAVRELAMANLDRPKLEALQVMYWLDRKRAVGDFLRIVREAEPALQLLKDEKLDPKKVDVIVDDRDPRSVRRGHFYTIVAMISRFLADEKCLAAVPALVKLAEEQARTRAEPRRGLMRSLGELGDRAAVPVLLKYAAGDVDDAEVAVEALGRCGDPAAIPAVRRHIGNDYTPLARNAVLALGRLGDRESMPLFRKLLTHRDEDVRGSAAEAIALIGDAGGLDALSKAAEAEPVAWTRQTMQRAIAKLRPPR